jgi:hypothetical protein
MTECVEPLITYHCNVIVFGKAGVTAPIANALFPDSEKIFKEAESQDFSNRQVGSVEYKVQLVDTCAQGKPLISAANDVKSIEKQCAQKLPEGINLAIFVLSFTDYHIDEREVETLGIVLDNMEQSVVGEMAIFVLSVNRKLEKEPALELFKIMEDRLLKIEKERVLALLSCLHKRLVISVWETGDQKSDIEEDHHKMQTAKSDTQELSTGTQKLKDILHSSKEMWLASELFQIKQEQSTDKPSKVSRQSCKDSKRAPQSYTETVPVTAPPGKSLIRGGCKQDSK